ncbi:MAG: L,D-transpeptidase family protein [Acidobacteriota bacterium]|nr:L,D-transpeptidase family protein [Acidobacteriota bacterium]
MCAAVLIVGVAVNQFLVLGESDLPALKNPKLIVTKSERKLEVFDGEELIKTYRIALGSSPVGDKEVEGDGKTPEGGFYIFTKNPQSSFYLSLGLSYPNIEDAKRGLEGKLITQEEHDQIVAAIDQKTMPPQNTALGGEIYIHGNGDLADWTAGCIALSNSSMKELFDALPVGTTVQINP